MNMQMRNQANRLQGRVAQPDIMASGHPRQTQVPRRQLDSKQPIYYSFVDVLWRFVPWRWRYFGRGAKRSQLRAP